MGAAEGDGSVGRVVVIAGPTASGKSALALALADALNGIVINADSMQVYRELRVLTARPSLEEEAIVPHRLYGVIPAAERCSAGRWRQWAAPAIAKAFACGRTPIVVGGTGFYIETLRDGLSPVPEVPEPILAAATARCKRQGAVAFAAELTARDPLAANLKLIDPQRTVRAWAVFETTGRSLAYWQGLPREGLPWPTTVAWLNPPRTKLYARCDHRLQAMVDAGALAEVEALIEQNLPPDLPAMKALGVAELAAYLDGRLSRADALAAAQQETRRFAKRQLSWFRHRLPDAFRIDAQYSEIILPKILSFIRQTG